MTAASPEFGIRRDQVPPPDVRLGIEDIDPERAYQLLAENKNNRKLRPLVVSQYARDMKSGAWRPGAGEPIHIAPDGEIGNGQHRLYAVMEAEVTVALPILYAPLDYRQVADSGIKRKFSDKLTIEHGLQNANAIAAAVRTLLDYEQTGQVGARAYSASDTELAAFLAAHPGLENSVIHGKRAHVMGLMPSVGTPFHYLFAKVDNHDANVFFSRLTDGAGLAAGDPILALRATLMRAGGDRRRAERTKRYQAALLIKTWNAWRQGRRITRIGWSPGGASPERFPVIEGLD